MTIEAAKQAMHEGRLPEARHYLEQLVRNPSAGPEIHYNLGMVLSRLGDFGAAAVQFDHCARYAPGNPDILNNLGNALRLSGQSGQAGRVLDRAIQQAPRHPALHTNRGWLRLALGRHEAAADDFRSALAQDESIEDAWRGAAEALMAGGDLKQAASIARQALRKFPRSAALHNVLGVIHNRQKNTAEALSHFKHSVKLHPGNPEALTNLGITAEQLGELSLAEQALQRALEARPGYPAAHFHLAHLASHAAKPEDVVALEQALEAAGDNGAQIDLEFALGKTLAKLGEHERAFPHFMSARQKLQGKQRFDLDRALARLDAAGRDSLTLTPGRPQRLFVVGMPRAGTTLIDQILAAHPAVVSLGESGLPAALERKANAAGPLSPQTRDQLQEWLRTQLPVREKGGRVVDTSPGHFTQLGLLATLLPEARFIHCVRDPLDTCVSIFEQPLTARHAYANTLSGLGRYYNAYRELMNRWQSLLGNRLHVVRYEALVNQPEAEISRLLEHCGLPLEPSCLEFHRHQRAVRTPSAAQVKQPLNNRSVGRWRHYEPFLRPLVTALGGDTSPRDG